eukprot:scaffold1204_cov407-Prasinococcus_capsulatus_cf.AAC.9
MSANGLVQRFPQRSHYPTAAHHLPICHVVSLLQAYTSGALPRDLLGRAVMPLHETRRFLGFLQQQVMLKEGA